MSSVLTERMALRRFTAADAANLLSLDGDPLVMRYLEGSTKSLRFARTVHLDWPDPLEGNEHGDVEYRLLRADWAATHHTAPARPRPER